MNLRTTCALLASSTLALTACGDAAEDGSDATVDSAPADTAPADSAVETADTAEPTPLCSTAGMGAPWTLDGLSADGAFFAGYVDLALTDPDRTTAAHGVLPESPGRTIVARVWYPAEKGALGDLTPPLLAPLARADGPFPLLVHSHGFSSNKEELAYAAGWLATRGWVVALLEFPLTNLSTAGGPQIGDVVNQPGDVSFVLDQLLLRSDLESDPLYGGIDGERIALSGLSLGGLTTLIATYHRDWHDPRVKAAIDIAGPAAFFTERFYSYVPLPTLLLYGDADALVDYTAHALTARERAPAGTRLLTLAAGSHTGFAGAARLFESLDNPDTVGCATIKNLLSEDELLLDGFADPDIGVEPVPLTTPCLADTLPRAMRPSRQHLLTRLALYTWLQLKLAADPSARASACEFLETLDALDDVSFE